MSWTVEGPSILDELLNFFPFSSSRFCHTRVNSTFQLASSLSSERAYKHASIFDSRSTQSDEDILAAEEEENFSSERDSVLCAVDLQHPVVYSTYNVCTLVKEDKLTKRNVNTLREICEALDLEVPAEPIRRKAPYIDLIEDAVKRCTCMGGPPS